MDEDVEYGRGIAGLVTVVQRLSLARDISTLHGIVGRAARALTGADGAALVLRDGAEVVYVDEDAIGPLWKGKRFPDDVCISGWVMDHRSPVVIPDVYQDERIPHDAFRSTFVQSLAMVPIRSFDPLGAIGIYWADNHRPTNEEIELLQALADTTAVALEHVATLAEVEQRVIDRTIELVDRTEEAETRAARLEVEVELQRETVDEVIELSLTDELTGLSNRRGFLVRADQARKDARRHGEASGLVFIDVDGLKSVNDNEGHEAGDRLLCDVAAFLTDALRDGDVVARWGGDEFVLFLPSVGNVNAMRKRFLGRLEVANDHRIGRPMAFSIGMTAVSDSDERPLERLVALADEAMYEDKRTRRALAS